MSYPLPVVLTAVCFTYFSALCPLYGLQSGARSTAGGSGVKGISAPSSSPVASPVTTFPSEVQIQSAPQSTDGVIYAQDHFGAAEYSEPLGACNECGVPNYAEPIGGSSIPVAAQESAGNIWSMHQPNSTVGVDHGLWDYFLNKYVVTDPHGLNRVDYQNVTAQDRQYLQQYLQQLQSTDVRQLNRDQQLAYWLNFYNAQTAETVLGAYPVRSIRQIKESFFEVMGPFNIPVVTVLGQTLSLSDIENNVVRANWGDPRIHYALNCASYGCPNLDSRAWQAPDLDARLDHAARQFINSGRAVKVGVLGSVSASKIFKWYKDDFGGSDETVLAHIGQYASGDLAAALNGRRRIAYYFYDWSLNDARVERPLILEPFIR